MGDPSLCTRRKNLKFRRLVSEMALDVYEKRAFHSEGSICGVVLVVIAIATCELGAKQKGIIDS